RCSRRHVGGDRGRHHRSCRQRGDPTSEPHRSAYSTSRRTHSANCPGGRTTTRGTHATHHRGEHTMKRSLPQQPVAGAEDAATTTATPKGAAKPSDLLDERLTTSSGLRGQWQEFAGRIRRGDLGSIDRKSVETDTYNGLCG